MWEWILSMIKITCNLTNGSNVVSGHDFSLDTAPGDMLLHDYMSAYFARRVDTNGDLILDRPFNGPSQVGACIALVQLGLTPAALADKLSQTHDAYIGLYQQLGRYITDSGSIDFNIGGETYTHKTLTQHQADQDQLLTHSSQQVAAKLGELDTWLSGVQNQQSHYRLTTNQVLIPNDEGTFPQHWNGGHVKRADLIETVSTGVETDQRSALAREFLSAINSDSRYFAGRFYIWELEYYPNPDEQVTDRRALAMYQYVRRPCYMTVAAIVKHIKGVVPSLYWCRGLQANQPARLCGDTFGPHRNNYTNIHPYIEGGGKPKTETTVIQVALPAAVSGYIDLSQGQWGQFPYLGNKDFSAFD